MIYDNLTQEKFQTIEDLVKMAIQAPNKASAQRFIDELRQKCDSLPPPVCNIASELISATSAASGKVEKKDFYAESANRKLFSLRSFIVKSNQHDI